MATINVYHEQSNRNYTITVDIFGTLTDYDRLSESSEAEWVGNTEYYLKISTNIRQGGTTTGPVYPVFLVRNMDDYPSDYSPTEYTGPVPPTNFQELMEIYIDYFINQGLLESSSSSSSYGFTSSSSSSIDSSSSSSSQSSAGQSSSSSSSESSSSSTDSSSSTESSSSSTESSSSSSSSSSTTSSTSSSSSDST